MSNKKCSECEVVKPLDEFSKHKRQKDGLQGQCKECVKEYNKQYHQDNKEKRNKQKAQYYQENKEKVNEYVRNKRVNEPAFALRDTVSAQIRQALNRNDGSKQGESVLQYLPYTIEDLWDHLRSLYTEGMTDANYGEWHIDHIYPQSLLPYKTMDDPNFLKAWALENLQPLWADENRIKSNKVITKG